MYETKIAQSTKEVINYEIALKKATRL
ncbi:hypothetical protein [Campylobacter hyointestinalis]